MESSSVNAQVDSREGEYAVCINGLCMSYGESKVVRNLCMSVKRKTVYGFLGSSGCGKTTVLSCIVGLKSWNSGEVLVFGRKPGSKNSGIPGKRLGYMPQDTALYNELSIREMMQFYGRIYNLPTKELNKQRRALIRLLELPSGGNKLIKKLSGGQKRRASLALALIHSPELLVLDEPTVGLDPVLRENIWNYLSQLVNNQGTTIILTTHYIEEARLANTIGVMRRGCILVEESPNKLLQQYNSCRLDQAVLHICKLDNDQIYNDDVTDQNNSQNCNASSLACWKLFTRTKTYDLESQRKGSLKALQEGRKEENEHSNIYNFIQTTLAFAKVIFLIFLRFPAFFLLVLFIPAIQGTITLWIIGSKPLGLSLGVVNHETLDCLKVTPQDLNPTSGCYFDSESTTAISLSCKYLHLLKQDPLFNLESFESEEQAKDYVSLGKSWGYISFPANWSKHFGDLMMARQYALNETIEGSRVPIYLDYSQYVSSFFMIRSMLLSYTKYLKEIALDCNSDDKAAGIPLNFRKPVYGDNEDNFTSFVMPGVLVFAIFAVGGMMTSLMLIDNRKLGIISRATVAGLTWGNIVTGHIIVQGILSIVQLAIWNIVMHYLFSIPTLGSIWQYVFICLLTALCGNTCGVFFGILLNDEVEALVAGLFATNVSILFGGVVWPPEAMSRFWQNFGSVLPTYLPTQAMRSVILRGVGIEHVTVWPGVVAAVVWIFVFISLSRLFYKKGI